MAYYVYSYLREDGASPYYIGKGTGYRAYSKHRRTTTTPPRERIKIIKDNLTHQEALELEALYIQMWGRKCDGGILTNLSTGGETGNTGHKHSEETKKKIGEGNRRVRGKTDEEKKAARARAQARYYRRNRPAGVRTYDTKWSDVL